MTETGAVEPLSLALADLAETHLACAEYGAAAEVAARAAQITADHGFRTRLAAALWAQARAQDGLSSRPHAVDLAQQAQAIYSAVQGAKAGTIQAQLASWQCS